MANRIMKYLIFIAFVFNGLFTTAALAQDRQEVVLTIKGVSSNDKLNHFNRAEELRQQGKYREAIEEYQKVLAPGELCGKESEAHYDIGICNIYIGKNDEAEHIFQEVIQTYPNNGETLAFSKYCLSWIDVQNRNYYPAIERLQQVLNAKIWTDPEFCSRAEFQIGRIYLAFINDYHKAQEVFDRVVIKYPNEKIMNHPFLDSAKKRLGMN